MDRKEDREFCQRHGLEIIFSVINTFVFAAALAAGIEDQSLIVVSFFNAAILASFISVVRYNPCYRAEVFSSFLFTILALYSYSFLPRPSLPMDVADAYPIALIFQAVFSMLKHLSQIDELIRGDGRPQ